MSALLIAKAVLIAKAQTEEIKSRHAYFAHVEGCEQCFNAHVRGDWSLRYRLCEDGQQAFDRANRAAERVRQARTAEVPA